MLWGYFFTNATTEHLEEAAHVLAAESYTVVDVFLSEKEMQDAPDMWWLHVERIEAHSVDSLYARNMDLYRFAEEHNLASYDGMDVGPVPDHRKAD